MGGTTEERASDAAVPRFFRPFDALEAVRAVSSSSCAATRAAAEMPNAYQLTLFSIPLAFAACALQIASAWRRARHQPEWFGLTTIALALHVPIALLGITAAALETGGWTDWQHMFWSLQIVLVCLFVASGPALSALAHARHDAIEPHPHARPGPGAWRGWAFLALIAGLAFAPIALANVWPDAPASRRACGAPGGRVVELTRFGLGGEVPAWLAPETEIERARGLAHLAREVTTPMGTLLVGAWAIIAFCGLALILRWCVPVRWRDLAAAWAPGGLALGVALATPGVVFLAGVAFDPAWFGPFSALQSGMWRSYPAELHGFGGVVLAAAVALLALALAQLVEAGWVRWRDR